MSKIIPIFLVSFIPLIFSQSCIYSKINTITFEEGQNNAQYLIKEKIIRPWIEESKYFIHSSDTIVVSIYENNKYGIYQYGAKESNHTTSEYQVIFKYKDQLKFANDIRSLIAHKKLLREFFSELDKNRVVITQKDRNDIENKIKNEILTNQKEPSTDKF